MKQTLCGLAVVLLFCLPSAAETTVKIDVEQSVKQISPYIYGQFIEHLGRCINGGGIWAEMLEDRKFFYPVGDKESPWKSIYDCRMRMVKDGAFVGEHAAESYTTDEDEPRWLGVRQLEFAVRKGKTYPGYAWVKASEGIEKVEVHFHWNPANHNDHDAFKMPVKAGEYYKIEFEFKPTADSDNVELEVAAFGKGTFTVGCVSLMPGDNVHGMRADTLELLKRLDSPIYRWPGGNFVSGYDWKDGIGDRDKRPPRKNPAWKGVEPNDFGLDEFIRFCRILRTEPYIAVNTGNGNVENAVKELEYANGSPDTPMGTLRKQNGNTEPYNVIWWGIGNEMYGDWQIGHMPVEKYIEKNNAFVDAFRAKDPKVKTVAVGALGKWDEVFLPGAADHMDLISEHFYDGERPNITEHVRLIPNSIKRIADAHRKYRKELPEFKDRNPPVPIALDEWNYCYYWDHRDGYHVFGELGARYFVKDGLGIAAGIHELARQADMYFMANYAQTVNVIGCIKTSKTAAQMESTGLVLELYRNRFGNVAVKTECADTALDVQAALHQTVLTVGIVNTSDKAETVKLDVAGYDISGKTVRQFVIADPENDPMGFNDPDKPQRISIVESELKSFDGSLVVKPYSVTLLRLE